MPRQAASEPIEAFATQHSGDFGSWITEQMALPATLEQYDALRKKEKQKQLAEMKTREMLIADGFLDPSVAQQVLHDDAALVELGSQRLQQLFESGGVSGSSRFCGLVRPGYILKARNLCLQCDVGFHGQLFVPKRCIERRSQRSVRLIILCVALGGSVGAG